MRRLLLILMVLLAVGAGTAPAQGPPPEPTAVLAEAREAFAAGRHGEAVRLLEPLADRFPYDADLLYNLGTAYAWQGRRGEAIWRLLQAFRLDPRDEAIRHNLRVLAPQIDEEIAVTPIPPVNWLYWWATGREWAMLAGALTLMACLTLGGGLVSGRGTVRRSRLMRAGGVVGLLALLAWPLAISHHVMTHERWQGVVVADEVAVRTGPSERQIETFTLPAGTLVRVDAQPEPGWIKVRFHGDKVGFVPRASIATL